jgi:phosphatidylglycerophosphate synthase
VAVILLAGPMRDGRVPALLVGLVALVLWQVAYSMDCADGQLARVTGQGSPAGARIDVLCDIAIQISLVAAVATVAHAYRPGLSVWLVAAFAGTWMVNLVTSVMQQGASAQSLVTSRSPVIRVVKLVRDYGAVVTVLALVIAIVPRWTVWVMVAFTAVNGLFLLASIAATARAALHASRPAGVDPGGDPALDAGSDAAIDPGTGPAVDLGDGTGSGNPTGVRARAGRPVGE